VKFNREVVEYSSNGDRQRRIRTKRSTEKESESAAQQSSLHLPWRPSKAIGLTVPVLYGTVPVARVANRAEQITSAMRHLGQGCYDPAVLGQSLLQCSGLAAADLQIHQNPLDSSCCCALHVLPPSGVASWRTVCAKAQQQQQQQQQLGACRRRLPCSSSWPTASRLVGES
jgi:hypothetical protein